MVSMPRDGCIVHISDIWTEDGFKTYDEFKLIYGFEISWLAYTQIISAIPPYWKILLHGKETINTPDRMMYEDLLSKPKPFSYVYNFIVTQDSVNIYSFYV